MPRYFDPIWSFAFLVFWIYVTWAWVRWFRSRKSAGAPQRGRTTGAALGLATISTLLSGFLYVHAMYTGGYPYYDPVELFCLRIGLLTALLGLVLGLIGGRIVRIPIVIISTLNLLLWLIDSIAQ